MKAPLEGIRVVEIASYVAAPAAGALLADLGAEVIKVEIPAGEIYRHSTPRRTGFKGDEFPEAPHYHMDNRRKRSLALDITRPAARDALLRVIDGCDIVLSNMLPHRREKYGIDTPTLRANRPELIVGVMSGYGPDGPDAQTPSFDYAAYWARTGFMDLMRDEGAAPSFLRPGVGDHAAALALTTGILAALRMRDASGEGQEVHVPLMHAGFYVLGNDVSMSLVTDRDPPRHDREAPRNPLWNHYETSAGRWLFLVMIESDRYWEPFCRAVERPDWIDAEAYRDAIARYRNSRALTAEIAAIFRGRTLEAWEETFAGAGLIWSPVKTVTEALADPQTEAMGALQEVTHPVAGRFKQIAPPIHMSAYSLRSDQAGPVLGAHGPEILREAGLSDEEIEDILA